MKVPLRSFSQSLDAVGRRICERRQVFVAQNEDAHRCTSVRQSPPLIKGESSQPKSRFTTNQKRIRNLRIGYSDPVTPKETAGGSLSPHLAPLQMEVGPDLWHPRRVRYLGLVIPPRLNDQTVGTP